MSFLHLTIAQEPHQIRLLTQRLNVTATIILKLCIVLGDAVPTKTLPGAAQMLKMLTIGIALSPLQAISATLMSLPATVAIRKQLCSQSNQPEQLH